MGEASTVSRSPMTMHKVTIMTKPIDPLMMAVHIMASGKVRDASMSSSDMCVALSGPMKENTGDRIPTRQLSPCELQPPPLLKEVKTSLAGETSANTQSTMRMAKKPQMCRTRTTPSRRGSLEARKVLKMIEKVKTAQTISVPCQAVGL